MLNNIGNVSGQTDCGLSVCAKLVLNEISNLQEFLSSD